MRFMGGYNVSAHKLWMLNTGLVIMESKYERIIKKSLQ